MLFDDEGTTEGTETDASSERVRVAWDESTAPTTAIVEAVAAANGQDPLEMPSLYDSLDVEALDGLLTGNCSGALGSVSISFTYDGTYVWVSSDGVIEVDPEAASSR